MTGTIKISELNAAASLTGTEEVPIVAGGATKRTTTLAIANLASVSSGTITIGNTPISGGTTTRVLYDNGGFVGEYAISGTGSVAMTNSPTLVTPALGVPTSLTLTNATGLPVGGIDATGTPSVSTFLRGDGSWAAAGAGTVTSVAQTFTGGLISVAGSPITSSGTLALTVAGTSGGIPYFSSSSAWASSAALAATALVIGGGAGAAPATSANLTFSSPTLTIGVASTTQGQLALANTTANSVTVQSSNSTSAAWTLTLPVDAGTNGYALTTNGSGVASWSAISASPGGSTTQVQYNNAGAFAGDSGFTYSSTNKAITLGGATVTASAPVLNLSQTWNSGGTTFTGLKLNVTDTASASASLLMDLQVGGSSKARLGKLGNMFLADAGTTSLPALAISATNSGIYSRFGGVLTFVVNGGASAEIVGVGSEGLKLNASSPLTWSSSGISGVSDVLLYRDAANTLALRNSTSAQNQRWYSTYTDSSNGSWAFINAAQTGGTEGGAANTLTIGSIGNGSNAAAMTKFKLLVDGTNRLDYGVTNAGRWTTPDSFTCNQIQAGIVYSTSGFGMGTSGSLGVFQAAADGVWTLYDAAQTNWGRLNFGGTTSSFPALKRSSTTLQARLADDSGYATLQGILQADVNAVAETPTATHTIRIYDASGTAYDVLCVAA